VSDQQGGPPDDPYADLVKPAGRRAPADPYADLTASPASSGDVDLSKPGTPNERRAGKVPGAPVLTPPPMAPRDASRVALNARQTYRPGAIERGLDQAGQFIGEAVHDPLGTAAGLVTAPVRSAVHAVLSPTIGDPRANPNHSKGGNSAGVTAAMLAQPYDAEHGGITERERAAAGLQTVANVAFPGIESAVAERATAAGASRLGGKLLGLAAAGAPAGAAYSPDDPMAGLIAGGLLAPVFGLAHEGATKGVAATRDAAGAVRRALPARGAQVAGGPETPRAGLTGLLRRSAGQGGPEAGVSLDAPPTLEAVHAALADLQGQFATATDPMVRGELESRLNMLELQRRHLTGEPMPEMAGAEGARAAAAAGVRHVEDIPKPAPAPEAASPYADLTDATPQGTPSAGFTTAKGSRYAVEADGTTTRDKAHRSEHPGDAGPQERSQRTFYVDDAGLQALGEIQAQGSAGRRRLASLPDGRVGIRYEDGPSAGQFEGRTVTKVHPAPAVGLYPVEVWQDGQVHHFGNRITEVQSAAPSASRPAFRDLLGMAPEDIQRHAEAARAADARIEPELFGEEGAKRYQRLQRVANSTTRSHEETAAASDEIARMESTLSDAQRDRLYGIGDQGLSADDLKAAASSATFYHPDNAQHLNDANLLSTVGRELTTGRPESDITSALNLRGAAAELQRRTGKPMERIVMDALAERGRRGELGSATQAGELLRARMAALHEAGLFSDAGPVDVAPEAPRLAAPKAPAADPYADLTGEAGARDLFGEKVAPTEPAQAGLFGDREGTEAARTLRETEAAARAQLDQLRERLDLTDDATERQQIAARMAPLEKLVNRGEKIGADELGHRTTAESTPDAPREPMPVFRDEPVPTDEATGRRAGVVLDEDGTHRFASARTASGAKRPVARVSTPGLLDELLDMEHRRASAESGSVYEWTPDDNFHATTDGSSVEHATRKGKGPSRQAKALTNLDAFARAQRAIEAELATRGLSGDALTERLEAHHEMREERRAMGGDYDPANVTRDQVRNESGEVLFSQTPGAFAREIAASRAAEGKPPIARSKSATPEPRIEPGGTVSHPSRLQQRMAVVRSAIRIDAFKDALLKVFGPASRSEDAGTIALAIRDAGGAFARRNELAREALTEFAGTFDRMPEADRLDFIDRVEGGRPQDNPALQKAADIMRHLLDSARDEIRGLGTGKLSHWIENYFPHLWENADEAVTFIDRVMSKRSMSGPGTFLKQRSIPTLREGIEAGLEPLTTNPIDMTLLKLREMHKYLAGQQILAELKQSGMAKFVNALERGPSGLVKLDDKLGTIYGPPHVSVTEGFDKVVRGKLEAIMQELGVQHTRKANIGGSGRMGFAEGGQRVTTKAGGPDTVIEHELGHILDAQLGVWDRLTKMPGTDRASIEARKQLHQELRDLADMRMEGEDTGDLPKSYKQYLRKKEEKIANAVHALVYMPERMQEVAPMVKARLTDILNSHPVARKLLDVKPSLALGTAEYQVPVGGLVVKGHWYVPEPVGRVINNHLSPGLAGNPFYDLYRGVGNSMNQWQLGFSAFHLGFTSMDAAVSKTALGIEQGFAGRPMDAITSIANVPLAPITNYLRGSKVLREYLAPGTEGAEMAATVDALVRGGGRVRMDEFYGGGAYKQFREALNARKLGKATRLAMPALLEGSGKLVMEHIVPRQKLGVFADLAQFELSKLPPDATKEQVRAVMAHAWDSVDNRMGQLVYDNLFWHRAAKDLVMASVRSVGWNVGTLRELGGGIGDAVGLPRALAHRAASRAGLPGEWSGANEPATLTHRTAYVMALPMTVGLAGAVINYLYTGEPPKELKDYFYPRTGRKNQDGTDERIQLPSYMRDVGDYGRHPVQTMVNKLHPLAGVLRDMLANADFYGHEIHNPDDPMVQQAMQQAEYVAAQFQPFGVRNAMTQIKQGQGRSAALNFIGITPAPREETRTAADLRMSQEMGRRARGNLTPEEVEKQGQRRSLLGALRMHNPKASDLANEAMRSGAIAPKDLDHVLRDASMPPDVQRFSRLPLAEAQRVYKLATPEEQRRFAPVLFKKMDNAKARGSLLKAAGLQ
jgi:hypothetical protein